MAQNDAASVFTRHREFYFPDGSVIVIIEATVFRVHQSVLSRHSDVFAGMWDVPQPEGFTKIDGCPTVELQDRASDFTDTLKAIYDSFHFDNLPPNADLSTLLTFLSGILRIATKYNMQQLRKKCITLLCQKFPSTLSGCDTVIAQQYQYNPSTIVRLIPLARETNIPAVLPWAYYLCTQMSIAELMANADLSWRDKALCLAGKERLWEAQKTITHPFLLEFSRSSQCSGGLCSTGLKKPIANWRESENRRSMPHPMEPYRDWVALGTCVRCTAIYEAQHKAGREKVWDQLPSFYQLGSWDDIRKDQNC